MKIATVALLVTVLLTSCGQPAPEKHTYTEKDVEGYWATYPTLHPSALADIIADSNAFINESILRFYNDVNGFSDSTYFIKGDSIFVAQYGGWGEEFEAKYLLKYRIRFASTDRLELLELKTGQFIRLYSLMTLPERNPKLEKLELNPLCDEGFRWSRDSLTSTFNSDCTLGCYFGNRPRVVTTSDSSKFARIDKLYRRVNLANVMLEFPKTEKGLPLTADAINLVGVHRIDYLPVSRQNVDPCLLAIRFECQAVMRWVYIAGE